MLEESLTIGILIGVCGLVAWLAKCKYQPDIERDIEERQQKSLKLSNRMSKK